MSNEKVVWPFYYSKFPNKYFSEFIWPNMLINFFMIFFNNLPVYKVVRLVFTLLLYCLLEINNSRFPNIAEPIIRNTTKIDINDPPNITGFVYFIVKNSIYPEVQDDYFNVNCFGGRIRRTIEYCMYKVEDNLNFGFASPYPEDYFLSWVSRPINSSRFLNKNYVNPPTIHIDMTQIYQNVTYGNVTVSDKFFHNITNLFYIDPQKNGDFDNFTKSEAAKNFTYIKRGYFYYSIKGKAFLEQKLENIESKIRYNYRKIEDQELFHEANRYLFSNCNPGDVRVKFEVYAPLHATFFGYMKNFTLYPLYIDNMRFGATMRGTASLKELVYYYEPDVNENGIGDVFPILTKFYAMMVLFIYIFHRVPDQIERAYWLVVSGCINLTFRSIIWDTPFKDFHVWSKITTVVILAGNFLKFWRFRSIFQYFQHIYRMLR
ncbi:hypothetical protein TRFO_15567 [Tritrichomonas foetus]|uniref:Uncharacterized protein n=1 Tax=Tritrichomonas foetus TaxID=1144522 RepID=A0A1J4KT55_9EUKA|nr:hypothetical protein TRFO_15567 [Tritrichomonas foetus]|eukprot:OHT14064.1 hypothetical protein TRFO_15567 [Tritrichomonas foetus]